MVHQGLLTALLVLAPPPPDAVILENSVTLEICSVYTETTRLVVIPLTGRGIVRYGSVSIPFRSGWEKIEVIEARTGHWRSGRRGGPATVSEGPHRALALQGRLESTMREMVFTMPGLETGDTVVVHTRRTVLRLPLADCYSYLFSPGGVDSLVSGELTVINGGGGELLTEWSDCMGPPLVAGNVTRWRAGPLGSFDNHPLAADRKPYAAVSTMEPRRVSRELFGSLDLFPPPDPSLLDQVILRAGGTPLQLRKWVADNIEYLGADIGDWPGFTPKSPEETLSERAGVCRDSAVLLAHLIRRTGNEAWLAMIQTGTGGTPGLVGSRSFNHMVVAVPQDTGFTVLDPSVRGLSHGHSYGLRGARFLPLTPEGAPLQTIPVDGWDDRLVMTLRGALEGESLEGELRVHASGAPAELLSTILERVPGAYRSLMFKRFFGASSVTSVEAGEDTLVVKGSWSAPGSRGAHILPGLRDISLPGTRAAFMLIPRMPEVPRLDSPAREELELLIHTGGRTLRLPSPIDSPGYSCSLFIRGDTLVLRETALVGPLFPSPDRIRETLLLRSGTRGRTVIFE